MQTIEDLKKFCADHGEIYMYGNGTNQIRIAQFLEQAGFKISGYVTSNEYIDGVNGTTTLAELKEITSTCVVGVIIAVADASFNDVIRNLERIDISNNDMFKAFIILKNVF